MLTAELARRADRVVCVEIDGRLLPVLAETLAGFQNVEIVNADVMKVDLRALIAEKLGGLRVVVCANLPYYITSPIVMGLLEQRLPIESVTVMVQKEAAQRLCALPGHAGGGRGVLRRALLQRAEGALSRFARVIFALARRGFRRHPAGYPPGAARRPGDEKTFFRVVRAAFSMRRKTLLNCLSAGLPLPKERAAALLERAGVPAGARAEQLTLEQFAAVSRALAEEP